MIKVEEGEERNEVEELERQRVNERIREEEERIESHLKFLTLIMAINAQVYQDTHKKNTSLDKISSQEAQEDNSDLSSP